jgi:integrase
MATFQKRNGAVRAIVRIAGHATRTGTFDTEAEARDWAGKVEAKLRRSSPRQVVAYNIRTMRELFERYAAEVAPTKRGARFEVIRLNALCRGALASINPVTLGPDDIRAWRDERLESVSAATVLRELTQISAVIRHAREEWGLPLQTNPVSEVKKPSAPPPRDRRILPQDEQAILDAFEFDLSRPPRNYRQWIGVTFAFALETAARRGEILGLLWADVHIQERWVLFRGTKNGSDRQAPLSTRAVSILESLPRTDARAFPIAGGTFEALWRRWRPVPGLHFHDTRREATTRLSKKFDALELARITGHRDLKVLLSTYYRPTIQDLAAKLD